MYKQIFPRFPFYIVWYSFCRFEQRGRVAVLQTTMVELCQVKISREEPFLGLWKNIFLLNIIFNPQSFLLSSLVIYFIKKYF